jgi:hypothetical protein
MYLLIAIRQPMATPLSVRGKVAGPFASALGGILTRAQPRHQRARPHLPEAGERTHAPVDSRSGTRLLAQKVAFWPLLNGLSSYCVSGCTAEPLLNSVTIKVWAFNYFGKRIVSGGAIEGFGSIVTSTTAPIATGWSNPLPGGNYTH